MTDFCHNCFAPGFHGECGVCGYKALSDAGVSIVLEPGTTLNGQYLLGRLLGAGGFGVTYLAKDTKGGGKVAIKEYMPATFAVRTRDGKTIIPSGGDSKGLFAHGLEVFNREAKTLKLFAGANNIVQVMDAFDENGTSYFVMEFLDGITLGGLLRAAGGRLAVDTATEIVRLTATALTSVHAQGMLHRDVSPENIIITKQGQVKLIDFGATRYFVSEKSRSLSVVLKAGFAPPEQYSSKGNQGPWTDIYALCATFYNVITGNRLPDAPDRLNDPQIENLRTYGVSVEMADAVQAGLELDYRKRTQSMDVFLGSMQGDCLSQPSPQPVSQPKREKPVQQKPVQHEPQLKPKQYEPQKNPLQNNVQQRNRLQVQVQGTPYVRLVQSRDGTDQWILPKNVPMRIGRSSEQCNIVIDHKSISRVHCELSFDEKLGSFFLRDLSSNGIYVGSIRLERDRIYQVQPGESFSIAAQDCTLEVGLC